MKNSKIVIQKRHNHILELLKQNRTMDVTVLAERLGVTGATIRRDLKKLEQEGTIVRSFGKVSFVGKINVEEIEPTNIEDEKKWCDVPSHDMRREWWRTEMYCS